ncbi:MAG: ADP-forming succinate--CoA ligase subunit beta [Rectinema sp.]
MKLLEYKAHEIFHRYGIPSMDGQVVDSPEELKIIADHISLPAVIKAQVQTGGRGKAGGVQIATNKQDLVEKGTAILAMKIKDLPVKKIFITKKVDYLKELYLSFTLDRRSKKVVLIFSKEGGMEINEIAGKRPELIAKVLIYPLSRSLDDFYIQYAIDKSGLEDCYVESFRDICKKLYKLFLEESCLLAEINPLAIDSSNNLIALDGKIEIDDNALLKHEEIRILRDKLEDNPLVLEARKFRFLYIPISEKGNIGIISNGSGMIMSTLDLIVKKGMKVGCALDLGGGATSDRVSESLHIVASNNSINMIFINIFGGITRCDEIAIGIKNALHNLSTVKFFVRLEGTNKEKGQEILRQLGSNVLLADGLRHGVELLAQESGL